MTKASDDTRATVSADRAGIWGTIERYYLGEYPVFPITIIRIGLGFFFLMRYALHGPFMADVFGPEGIVAMTHGPNWVNEHYLLIWVVLLVAAAAYMVGLLSRVSGLVLIACHIALHYQTWGYAWGDATTGHVFVAYTLLANPGARLSVDAVLRRRIDPDYQLPRVTAAAAVRFLQLHIVAIYFMASYNRVWSTGWHKGRMTFVALNHGVFSRFSWVNFHRLRTLLWLGTWYTWVVELSAPLALWIKKTAPLWVVLLALMHLGLHVTSTIGSWQLNMMTILVVFLPPEWLEPVVVRIERRVGLIDHAGGGTPMRGEHDHATNEP